MFSMFCMMLLLMMRLLLHFIFSHSLSSGLMSIKDWILADVCVY